MKLSDWLKILFWVDVVILSVYGLGYLQRRHGLSIEDLNGYLETTLGVMAHGLIAMICFAIPPIVFAMYRRRRDARQDSLS